MYNVAYGAIAKRRPIVNISMMIKAIKDHSTNFNCSNPKPRPDTAFLPDLHQVKYNLQL